MKKSLYKEKMQGLLIFFEGKSVNLVEVYIKFCENIFNLLHKSTCTYCLFAFASCESALIFEIEFEMKSF